MKNKVSVLVSGCDRYSDAWDPFFTLLKKFGGTLCDCPIYLSAESKEYTRQDFSNFNILHDTTSKTWSQRMLKALEAIKTEYVFLLLEDFFLDQPFNEEYFQKAIDYMDENSGVGVINLSHTTKVHEPKDDVFFERDFARLGIVVTAVLYRNSILKGLLRRHENIWHYEQYSGVRAKKYHVKVMQYNEKYPTIFSYDHTLYTGTAISKGKWLPNTKVLFEKNGIIVDYEKLGWYKEELEEPLQEKKEYFIKIICKKIKNKINYWKSIR